MPAHPGIGRRPGETMTRSNLTETEVASKLEDIISGYQKTQALVVMAKLGLADQLDKGPRGVAARAAATQSDAGALYRLLRAPAYLEAVPAPPPGVFAL